MNIFHTQSFTGQLVLETCCNCGMAFGLERNFYDRKSEDHSTFYCPKGHPQHYTGKSEEEKLQEEITKLNQRNLNLHQTISEKNQRIEQLNYSVRAQKAAKTKILNRVKNGVCPCCNRQFKDLQNHFKSKHPELLEN